MPATAIPPPRRTDLLLKPLGDDGQHVVKDLRSGTYFNLPPAEAFLLDQLDGQRSADDICTAFQSRFGEPLTPDDLDEFLSVARGQNLLDVPSAPSAAPKPIKPRTLVARILYCRFSVFDPDGLFNWLAPRLTFCWTPAFVVGSAFLMVIAGFLHWQNFPEYAEYFPENLTWETVILAWIILVVVTTIHEFGHGLTCKHFGGEVHELGVLLVMLFMPCFYCNVSDAWLIRQRSRRLWITLAGGYCDLCCWAGATLLWRVLLPHTMPYRICWLVMSICGGRVLINLNPLVRLDGYYLATDVLGIPNLRPSALGRVAAYLRTLLWGADWPAPEPRNRTLVAFGLTSWTFSSCYLSLMLFGLFHLLHAYVGFAAVVPVSILIWLIVPTLCRGSFEGEFMNMLKTRPVRTACWVLVLAGVPTALYLIPKDDSVIGTFKARPAVRVEVRAPVPGFLREIRYDEGDSVAAGALLAMLDIPDLASKIAQKRAEEQEADAKVKLLLAGNRPEEIAEQRDKVRRADDWVKLAEHELKCRKAALKEELHRLAEAIVQAHTQLTFAAGTLGRSEKLYAKNVLPLDQLEDARRAHKQAQGALNQAEAQKRERLAIGTLNEESELAKRVKDLADAKSALTLLAAGSRPEQIDAEKAHLVRVQEERAFLEQQQARLKIACPVKGVIVTPRVREKAGVFLKEGDVICEIEDPDSLELEVPLEEQDVSKVEPSQLVDLKPRAMPMHTFHARVERLAPVAIAGKVQSTVMVYCRLEEPAYDLRSGMTGYARIHCGEASLASFLAYRAIRYLRTEVWW